MKETFIIGVGGGTGSGKTTVATRISEILHKDISLIELDSYYKNMNKIPVEERNYDHPDAFDFDRLIEDLNVLKSGKDVEIPIYDYTTHTRLKETHSVKWKSVIILEGILIFFPPKLRKLMDFKIYVDTPSDIRILRRMRRDISERGRTVESVINQYLNTVRPMHIEFVAPSKKYADIIVPEGGYNEKAIELMASYLKNRT